MRLRDGGVVVAALAIRIFPMFVALRMPTFVHKYRQYRIRSTTQTISYSTRRPYTASHSSLRLQESSNVDSTNTSSSRKEYTNELFTNNSNLTEKERRAEMIAKGGKLYFTIWTAIYLSCLVVIFGAVERDILNPERFGIDPAAYMTRLCDWLDGHIINVAWITHPLRTNPWMTKFATAYLLTDIVPTTFIAMGAFPLIDNQLKRRNANRATITTINATATTTITRPGTSSSELEVEDERQSISD